MNDNNPLKADGSLNLNFNPMLQTKRYLEFVKEYLENELKIRGIKISSESCLHYHWQSGWEISIYIMGKEENPHRRRYITIKYQNDDSWYLENKRSTQDVDFPYAKVCLVSSQSSFSFEIRTGLLGEGVFLEVVTCFLKGKK